MFSRFFIARPIFANVIAIVTMILGGVAVLALPVARYPDITPPTVKVTTTYPGASAQTVADTVAAPIEQQVNGVENMLYMSSTSASDGSYALTVTFEIGTNIDMAQVLVQNRVAIADASLPEEVKRQGVTTKKQSTAMVLVITLTSPDKSHDDLSLSNFATLRIKDELSRINGVGDVTIFGAANYGMRVWLDPAQMMSRKITTQDIVDAIEEQNAQVAAGQLGQPPASKGQTFQLTINALGRLKDAEQFENIVVKTGADGQVTYVKDVARVELGGQTYDQFSQKTGTPSGSLAVYQLPGANSLQIAEKVKAKMEQLRQEAFPKGIEYDIPFDTTRFVQESIHEVYKTLYEAGILVLIVILVFLQDWRAVLVPATTVPVTIIGAFAAMAMLGFSVNMLTLFGLILAIGIVVDDAIVIVENAAHHIDKSGLSPKDATIRAMDEVLGPVIGITFVLMAVFIPTAFLGGITGQLYRQFALTIAATALISAINALTLKPAQCATYLRKSPEHKNAFYRAFNAGYDWFEGIYVAIVRWMLRYTAISLVVFVLLVAITFWGYAQLPTGFLPVEDQGYVIVAVQLPDAASQERTRELLERLNKILKETKGIANWVVMGGYSVFDSAVASNAITMYVIWDPWEERTSHELSQEALLEKLRGEFAKIQEAIVYVFVPPAIEGLGVSGGFQMQVEDRGAAGLDTLRLMTDNMMENAATQSSITAVNTTFSPGVPQLYADVDRVKAKTMALPISTVFSTMQTYLGSQYVNDFNLFGRTYQVRVQADHKFRVKPSDVKFLEARNDRGEMVPIGSLLDIRETVGPQTITRYNLYPTASITGEAAPGYSSGQAMTVMEQLAKKTLPNTMGYDWTGMSFQEKRVGNESIYIFALAVLLVYLVLAAQYESWISPLAVILVVPLGLLGSMLAVAIRGMDNNVYTQIGIVLIIALASKNAILIVEFSRELRIKRGMSIYDSAVNSAKMRFRPILMTSFAFILGVYPLVIAEGAGAGSRQALGTAVFGGMISSTILAVFWTPVFYIVSQRFIEWHNPLPTNETPSETHP